MTDYHKRSYDQHLDSVVAEIRNNIAALQTSNALLAEIIKRHDASIADTNATLYGKDGKNGVNGRLNSLERDRDRRQRHFWLIWGAIVMSWISYLFDGFSKMFRQ